MSQREEDTRPSPVRTSSVFQKDLGLLPFQTAIIIAFVLGIVLIEVFHVSRDIVQLGDVGLLFVSLVFCFVWDSIRLRLQGKNSSPDDEKNKEL
jgi:hypothetical protein